MSQLEEERPNAGSIADSVAEIFRTGRWNDLPTADPVELLASVDDPLAPKVNGYMNGFVRSLYEMGVTGIENPRIDRYIQSMYNVYTYMNTAVINIKTEPKTKKEAQKVAKEIGMSLSGIINGYLKQFIRTKKVEFSVEEEPSEYLKKVIRQAEKNLKAGKHSPVFKTGEEAVAWLEKQGI